MFGAIEAGGTKFVCGIGTGPDDLTTIQIPTTTPESTIAETLRFFRGSNTPLRAVGIGSFGPVDLHFGSPAFGCITSTPKPGWRNYDLAGSVNDYVVPPRLDSRSGVLGALVLAERALNPHQPNFTNPHSSSKMGIS